jgi:hypothetical protein
MKDFVLFYFLVLAFHSMIAQTDYKVDEKGKNGVWKGFIQSPKD